MALYSEDECGDLLQDLMGIPTSAALAILKTPLKKQKELLDLYYQVFLWNFQVNLNKESMQTKSSSVPADWIDLQIPKKCLTYIGLGQG